MKHYIYGLYTKNTTEPKLFYVGITSGDKNLYHRKRNHRTETHNPHKLAIIKKYDFNLRILWEADSREEAEDREEFLIRWLDNLCNICASANDMSHARSKPRKPRDQWKKHSDEARKANRDRNLSVPYDEVMGIIEEWKKNPLESQQDFANRKGISRSKFKDWLRLYDPESIGLTKKTHRKIFEEAYVDGDRPKDTIQKIMNNTGWTYNKSKGLYYRISGDK